MRQPRFLPLALNSYVSPQNRSKFGPIYHQLLAQRGHLSEAIAAYSAALQRQPADAFCLRCRAFALRKSGQLEEAIADLSQAIGLEPRFARTYADRAQLYRRLGRSREAHEDMQMFGQLSEA